MDRPRHVRPRLRNAKRGPREQVIDYVQSELDPAATLDVPYYVFAPHTTRLTRDRDRAIHCLHLDYSNHPLGSAVDEHEHIDESEIGKTEFHLFVSHGVSRENPLVLKTLEGEEDG